MIKTNKFLWYVTLICNILILLFGLGTIASDIYIIVEVSKADVFSIILGVLALIIILTSFLVIFSARYSTCVMSLTFFIHILIFLLVVVLAIFITVDFDKLINFICDHISQDEAALVKDKISNNIKFAQYASYVISVIMVSN